MTKDKINISDFPKHIFWNYAEGALLEKSIIIERVLLYGELSDFRKLMSLVTRDDIRKVNDQIEKSGKFKKRTNFINKVILS